jgi:hypothetical protein
VLYRRYQLRGTNRWLEIYVAYWAPWSVNLQEAGQHTPDTCWVNSGWQLAERRSGFIFEIYPVQLRPAEFGLFSKDRLSLHVAFSHIVGGKLHRYDQLGWDHGVTGFRFRFPKVLSDWRLYGLDQKQEQFFARIHSYEPHDTLLAEPAFNGLLRFLAPVGVTLTDSLGCGPA